jgi:iduronate 2-sulfatase
LDKADHGETLAEPGHQRYFGHGQSAYDEVVRIPLVVREPRGGRRLAALERERPVSPLDVAPTVLALLDVDAPAGFEGRSLLATSRAEGDPIYSMGAYGTERLEKEIGTQWSVLRGPMRYVLNSKDGSEELYDHRLDPKETNNLARREREQLAPLRAELAAVLGEAHVEAAARETSPEYVQGLKALGYVE